MEAPTPETNRMTWDFLADSYWYVPAPDLPALQFSPENNLLSWAGDQTVWHISGYQNGYFWGVSTAVIFNPGDSNGNNKCFRSPRHMALVGTVTASGQVQISFIRSGRHEESVTTGFGQMVNHDGQWAFQMHMATASGNGQLFHWADMLQTKEGDASWESLPGIACSVPSLVKGAHYPHFAPPA